MPYRFVFKVTKRLFGVGLLGDYPFSGFVYKRRVELVDKGKVELEDKGGGGWLLLAFFCESN